MTDTTMRISKETMKKIIQVRGRIEHATGKRTNIDQAVFQACDFFITNKGEKQK